MKSGQAVGKLGFAVTQKKESPVKKAFEEHDAVMEPMHHKEQEENLEKALSDTQEGIEDMEISKPARRGRKR